MNLLHGIRGASHGVHWLTFMALGVLTTNRNERAVRPCALPRFDPAKHDEYLQLFSRHVYGTIPDIDPTLGSIKENKQLFPNNAIKREITLLLSKEASGPRAHLLLLSPKGKGPHPVILGYNLEGNHTVHKDPSITKHPVWSKRIPGHSFVPNDSTRGKRSERWPVEKILSRGYALATVYYGDIEPDCRDTQEGIRARYPELQKRDDNFSAIGAWAWGLSRVMDYLERDALQYIEVKRVALFGFSRAGKAALLAAARDKRFAAVIAASSGKGGAALSRRNFGETVRLMTGKYPHWFSKTFASYAGRECELTVDQHMLLALIAPRKVLISSADRDWWSDPKGEQLAVETARSESGSDAIEHVLHPGDHNVTPDEWDDYLAFLDKNLT